MAKRPTAFLGALVFCLASGSAVLAEAVPLPRPAPFEKSTKDNDKPTPPGAIGIPDVPAPPSAGGSFFNFGKSSETTAAFDANQRALVDKVSVYLSNIRTLVGDFVQVGPNGSKTQGQLYLQKPGRIRFEYDEPSPIQLISDGQSLVVRDRKLATQDLYPLSQTPLRFILADRVDLLKDTNVVGVYSDDTFATVVIEEKSIGGTHRLMLMFGATDLTLKQWTITDPQGFDTTVAVYNLDTSKKPDPSLFKITYDVPKNTGNNN